MNIIFIDDELKVTCISKYVFTFVNYIKIFVQTLTFANKINGYEFIY